MDGAFDVHWRQPSADPAQLSNINNALSATLDPRVSNDVRKQALEYLEQLKSQPDAPQYGFALAEDWAQNDAVRHYGLQLLEYAVRYKWADYTGEQTAQLRTWIKCLAGSIREQDALYLRNKIAQLWIEVAKRSWGEEWLDMDTLLVAMWDKPLGVKGTANKTLILCILETLSEDIINSEDAVAGLRLDLLGNALNEIIVPAALYAESDAPRDDRRSLRCGDEGWLARVCDLFATCVKQIRLGASREEVQAMSFCAVKALHTLRPMMSWISLRAAVQVNCVDCLFLPFHTQDIALQTATVEVLHVLLSRPYAQHWHSSWLTLLDQALLPDRIQLFRQAFDSAQVTPGEDDAKYDVQKKLSELLSVLADAVALQPDVFLPKIDASAFFDLLLSVLQSKSLLVSIPVLHSWTRLMAVQQASVSDHVSQALGTLISTCSARLFRYESLAGQDDSEDEILQFLSEDFDTIPERHAFLGNYRRYCVSVVQTISRLHPRDALSHVLEQMREMLELGPYALGRDGFESEKYSKTGLSTLRFDAQYQVVSNALKGFSQWIADAASTSPDNEGHSKGEQDRSAVAEFLHQWTQNVMRIHVDDPEVAAQVLQTVVTILRVTKAEASFVLQVVQHLLTMDISVDPTHVALFDAVKAFEGLRVIEIQKLAIAFPNDLLEVYNELELRIGELIQRHSDDARLTWGYRAFLFIIVHRASGIDADVRLTQLQQMLKPVYDAWQAPGLTSSLTGLHEFYDSLALGDVADFYKTYRFAESSNWAGEELDQAGQAKQAEIRRKGDELPMRMTKSMLSASTEKLTRETEESDIACRLWGDVIPVILPNLLKMLRHAQAFHNMANWSQLPDELQMVVKRTLQDRFWQSGISNESKDEFYARISGSKTSFEGFASVVRGTMRNIREQSYHILYLMTKFEEQFYGLPDLAPSLAEALYADVPSLTANHLHPIINLTTGIVQHCPPHYRNVFLPPLLKQLFTQFDAKISSEWEAIGYASHQNAEDDELSEEMRTESVLRHLTYSMVSFVSFMLEPEVPAQAHGGANGHTVPRPTLRDLVLSDPAVLEPLILFCTHALRMHDTRCCTAICRVFRGMIPLFQTDDAPAPQVREFISTEVLMACISSLHEAYFADMQKDLAALIAQVIVIYAPRTSTPRDVLLSMPDMPPAKVDKTLGKIVKVGSERQQRALVLDLLDGVRGVRISETGKIAPKQGMSKKMALQRRYVEAERNQAAVVNGNDTDFEGVAGLFDAS